MVLKIDSKRGKEVAKMLLFSDFYKQNEMPEDLLPKGVKKGSLEHVMFITLTISIDYLRDAAALWNASRKTFEDPKTKYLFEPKSLYESAPEKIAIDMQKYNLSKRSNRDSFIWRTIGATFYEKWNGDPTEFLKSCDWDAPTILEQLQENKNRSYYPYLRGKKIGPLWLRMLKGNVGLELKNLDKIPIPVDVHVARATLATGVVRGQYKGNLNNLFEHIRKAWFESVKGLNLKDGKAVIALDMDEPLWNLSKYGCSKRNTKTGECKFISTCKVKDCCVKGQIQISNGRGIIDT